MFERTNFVCRLMGLCLIGCAAADVWADEPVAKNPPIVPFTPASVLQAERDAEERLLKSLQKQITVDWKGISLRDALNQIGKEIDGELWINQQALEDEGVHDKDAVNLTLGKASLWQTLHFLLGPQGLAWLPRRGILEITTQAQSDEIMVTRIYDVRRIVEALEPDLKQIQTERSNRRTSVIGELQIHVPPAVQIQSGADQSQVPRLGRQIGQENQLSVEQLFKELLSNAWLNWNGIGISDAVEIRRHQLIVRGTYRAHWKVQGILLAVESLLTNPGKANGWMANRPGYPFDEDQAIIQALTRTRRFNVTGLPLREVLLKITKDQGIRCIIDEPCLHDEKISLDAPVTEPATETSVSVMLKRILEPLGAGIAIEEGTLLVQSEAKIQERDLIGVYDMKDIPEAVNPRGLMYLVEKSTSNGGFLVRQEGYSAFLLSPHIFVARHTRLVHIEIDSLLTAMRRPPDPKAIPAAPMLQTCYYAVLDASARLDLMESLPELIPDWDAKQGKIYWIGQFLAVKQLPAVQAQVREIVDTINGQHLSYHRQKPASSPPTIPAK